jgi:bacillithiol biosynthesis cysteine-adding enzyme BshC
MSNIFFKDYVNNSTATGQFLPPFATVDWDKQTRNVVQNNSVHKRVGQILHQQNKQYNSPYLKHLGADNCVYIISGQQLGLLVSPLYTVFKALTAVKLAESLNRKNTANTFIPLFWLECEDHDFQEINHFHVWTKDNEILKIGYEGKEQLRQSIKQYRFTPAIQQVIKELKTNAVHTEFSDSLIDMISSEYKSGGSWVSATRNFMQQLLEKTGILYFNPGDPAIKELSSAFVTNWIDKMPQIMQAFSDQSSLLRRKGYDNQVADIEGKTFLHLVNENKEREHLYFKHNAYYSGVNDTKYSERELISYLTGNPENASTSVVSRPLLQSWLLPTAAYVAGPSEITYWAQLGKIFETMALEIPVVYPRISLTIIEPRIKRYLEKNELQSHEITPGKKKFLEKYFKDRLNRETRNPFLETRAQIDIQFEKIKSYIAKIDKTLFNTADKSYQSIMQQLQVLEGKTVRASQSGDDVTLKQLQQIHETFYPNETPQERILSPVYFLNKYGPSFIDRIYEQSRLGVAETQFIYL